MNFELVEKYHNWGEYYETYLREMYSLMMYEINNSKELFCDQPTPKQFVTFCFNNSSQHLYNGR